MVTKTREQLEAESRLIESYRYHNPVKGFDEWKEGTPNYVKIIYAGYYLLLVAID